MRSLSRAFSSSSIYFLLLAGFLLASLIPIATYSAWVFHAAKAEKVSDLQKHSLFDAMVLSQSISERIQDHEDDMLRLCHLLSTMEGETPLIEIREILQFYVGDRSDYQNMVYFPSGKSLGVIASGAEADGTVSLDRYARTIDAIKGRGEGAFLTQVVMDPIQMDNAVFVVAMTREHTYAAPSILISRLRGSAVLPKTNHSISLRGRPVAVIDANGAIVTDDAIHVAYHENNPDYVSFLENIRKEKVGFGEFRFPKGVDVSYAAFHQINGTPWTLIITAIQDDISVETWGYVQSLFGWILLGIAISFLFALWGSRTLARSLQAIAVQAAVMARVAATPGRALDTAPLELEITVPEYAPKEVFDLASSLKALVDRVEEGRIYLRSLIARSRVTLMVVDARGVVSSSLGSPFWEADDGKDRSLTNSYLVDILKFVPDIRDVFNQAKRGEETNTCVDIRNVVLDLWFAPLRGSSSDPQTGVIVLVSDVTSARRAAEHLVRLRENRQLNVRFMRMQEADHNRIARELHDEIGSLLVAVKSEAALANNRVKVTGDPAMARNLGAIGDMCDIAQEALHTVVSDLRARVLDDGGLSEALIDHFENWRRQNPGVTLDFNLKGDVNGLSAIVLEATYRIVRELLTNVTKHAQATAARVDIERHFKSSGAGDVVSITVYDNGVGISELPTDRFGLLGIRERVEALAGTFKLTSTPAPGTKIELEIPNALTT